MMRKVTNRYWVPLLMAAFCLSSAGAQQQQAPPTTPVPPAGGQNSGQEPASPVAAPFPTVTGGFAPSAGEIGNSQNQLAAGFFVNEQGDSNFGIGAAPNGWQAITNFGGHLSMQRMQANSSFSLNYSGGVQIDPSNSQLDNFFNQFEVNQTIQFRRWTLSLDDVFGFYPESSFGFAGNGVPGWSLLGTTNLDPSLQANQTILTPYGKRISNTGLAQVQVELSARTSLTFTGSESLLQYFETGYSNSNTYNFGGGYNYLLAPRDVIGFSYQFNDTQYSANGTLPGISSIKANAMYFNYGHHISQRLAFQAGIGPQIITYTVPGNTTSTNSVTWGTTGGLSYVRNQTTLSGSFFRGVSGGGGVLNGSITSTVTFSASQPVGRYWTASGSVGYALNQAVGLAPALVNSFDSLYASAGISRKLSESATFSANYGFQHHTTGAGVCTEPICAEAFNRHIISVNFAWNMRPVPIH
jgi:hypothetical protein